jgi:hypothetical protein
MSSLAYNKYKPRMLELKSFKQTMEYFKIKAKWGSISKIG